MDAEQTGRRMWGEKPYRSLDYELRRQFGEKVYKLTLNAGMTCPNRDGTVGTGGCIFCSAGGSGEFAASRELSIREQLQCQKEALREKKPAKKYIAYFQAYTNTYAPVEYLERVYTQAMEDADVVALSVATRPDCLPPDVLALLEKLNAEKPVWVELGLQTIHPRSAAFIRRGYELPCFAKAVGELRARGMDVIVHTILGLPGEERQEMLETVDYLNGAGIQGVKLQLLHILAGTDLGDLYLAQRERNLQAAPQGPGRGSCSRQESVREKISQAAPQEPDRDRCSQQENAQEKISQAAPRELDRGSCSRQESVREKISQAVPQIRVMEMEEYVDTVTDCIAHLSPDITVHRLTGDGPGKLLLAPLWSRRKRTVLNAIHSRMKEQDIWQGKLFSRGTQTEDPTPGSRIQSADRGRREKHE